MKRIDALKIFGLDQRSSLTETQIRKTYLALSRKHHPDKGGDPTKFKEIQAAYERLKSNEPDDPIGSENWKGDAFNGIFQKFDDIFSGFGETPRTRKQTIVKNVKLSVPDIFKGCYRDIKINKTTPCKQCEGTGTGSRVKCSDCGGTGVQVVRKRLPMGSQIFKSTCSTCKGRGGIGEGSQISCSKCRGHKHISEIETKRVNIPKGVPNNSKIMINEGDNPIMLRIKYPNNSHKDWDGWKLGDDRTLKKEYEIDLETALLGGKLNIKIPGNTEEVSVIIPASAQPKQEIIIPDKGLPACHEAKLPPSNAFIIINVKIPEIPKKHIENTKRFLSILKKS
jgi:DnaJ family protein A protein 2